MKTKNKLLYVFSYGNWISVSRSAVRLIYNNRHHMIIVTVEKISNLIIEGKNKLRNWFTRLSIWRLELNRTELSWTKLKVATKTTAKNIKNRISYRLHVKKSRIINTSSNYLIELNRLCKRWILHAFVSCKKPYDTTSIIAARIGKLSSMLAFFNFLF